jgi:endonuclease YncB( thermonuclease family)
MLQRTILAIILCLAIAVPAIAASQQFVAPVISVADGATITVLNSDKQQIKIRLYGIDCPDKRQTLGGKAAQATSDAVFGKRVTVRPMGADSDGRMVAVVMMPDGKSLLEHLVRGGLAKVSPQSCKHDDICAPLHKLEAAARGQKRGLWADKVPAPSADGFSFAPLAPSPSGFSSAPPR